MDESNQAFLLFGNGGSKNTSYYTFLHRRANNANGEITADDEDYEEIYQQLKYFRDDKEQNELILPEGMSQADIRVAQVGSLYQVSK